MRSMVEGAHLCASRNDARYDPVQIVENISRGDAHDGESLSIHNCVAGAVTLGLITVAVPFAVHFDDQPVAEASKICGHLLDGKLPAKLQAIRPRSQRLPQDNFRETHISPQLAGALDLLDRRLEDAWAPSTALRAVPLPVPGRIIDRRTRHLVTS
jgi:hypothetical protein